MNPNEELARREIEQIEAGDMDAVNAMYADDFVLHYPGRSPLAGTYHDVDDFLEKMGGLLDGGSLTRELHDALGTDEHAVQLLRVTAEAKGRSHIWRAVIVMHVRDGRFSEAWFHFDDQYALDEFLTSLAD
jgi:ketosteroid isomerase-like protein